MNPDFPGYTCNCFALRQATRFITQMYERHLAPVGLTPAQFTILARLARQPGLTMAELADVLVMDRTSVVRALKPLQRDGFVLAEAAEYDARAHALRLTKQGDAIFARAVSAWKAAQVEFETRFGRERARALRAELFSLTAD